VIIIGQTDLPSQRRQTGFMGRGQSIMHFASFRASQRFLNHVAENRVASDTTYNPFGIALRNAEQG
jgi:hypothetical protein